MNPAENFETKAGNMSQTRGKTGVKTWAETGVKT